MRDPRRDPCGNDVLASGTGGVEYLVHGLRQDPQDFLPFVVVTMRIKTGGSTPTNPDGVLLYSTELRLDEWRIELEPCKVLARAEGS